jgi:predicted nucleic-acid-binding Zn-ribbon protein
MAHLSKSDAQAILTELGKRGVKLAASPCPECAHPNWSVEDEIHLAPIIEINSPGTNHSIKADAGSGYLNVGCSNCGYTKSFNVGTIGYTHPGSL